MPEDALGGSGSGAPLYPRLWFGAGSSAPRHPVLLWWRCCAGDAQEHCDGFLLTAGLVCNSLYEPWFKTSWGKLVLSP